MKSIHFPGCMLLLLFVSVASAQDTPPQAIPPLNQHPVEKPALFSRLPEKINCSASSLQQLFALELNDKLTAQPNTLFLIEGTVSEKVAVSSRQLSINIRCTNFQNALLNISRITQPDGSYKYVGRIVHPQFGDLLLLGEDKGQYFFTKQKQLLTMVE